MFWVIGHRGTPTTEVENTLPSFTRALEEGARGLELDLCVTRDEQVVVWHDFDPGALEARLRRWGLEPDVRHRPHVPDDPRFRRPIANLTADDVRRNFGYVDKKTGERTPAHIPLLGDFFAWAARHRRLGLVFFDIKLPKSHLSLLPALLRQIDALAETYEPEFRIVLETAIPEVALVVRERAPHRSCAIDVEPPPGLLLDVAPYSAAEVASRHGLRHAMAQRPRGITLAPFWTHRRIVKRDLDFMTKSTKAAGGPAELFSFTINKEDEMRALLALGVTGIQSDVPGLLHAVAESAGVLAAHGVDGALEPASQARTSGARPSGGLTATVARRSMAARGIPSTAQDEGS